MKLRYERESSRAVNLRPIVLATKLSGVDHPQKFLVLASPRNAALHTAT